VEVEGRRLTDLAGGAWNIPTLIDRLNAVVAESADLDAFRVEHLFPGMGRRILVLNATKIFRPGHNSNRILLAIEDDTDRQAAEAELRALNAELESFAYSVAHDLRAPLRAMQGFGEILHEDYGARLDDKGRDYLSRISTAAVRMNEMIGDLLDYSRLAREQIEIVPVSLGDVVTAAREQLAEDLAARQAEIAVPTALPTVLGHQATLVQVVANLLTNAAKFVAPGRRPQIQVGAERRDRMVRFWVKDNGIGIAPEYHQRIFRVFERLHGQESYPGTGVGLAIVAKAAERMGGTAGVESALGAGACFWIEIHSADPQLV
jgi:signal transduction histidine kinase